MNPELNNMKKTIFLLEIPTDFVGSDAADVIYRCLSLLKGAMLLAIIVLSSCLVKAQNCHTRVDDRTGKVTKSGVTDLTGDSTLRSCRFAFIKTDADLFVSLTFIYPGSIGNLEAGKMQVTVKFVNGQTKVYSAGASSNALKMPGGTGVIFEGSLASEDLDYFHSNAVSQFILKFNAAESSDVTIPVTELNAKQIVGSLACLSSAQ